MKNILITFFILLTGLSINLQEDLLEEIKKARDSFDNRPDLYEETIAKFLTKKYDRWLETIEELKSDTELKYRKEAKNLGQTVRKKLFMDAILPKETRNQYERELLQLLVYVKKENLQMLSSLNKKISTEKNTLYVFSQVLGGIKKDLQSGIKVTDADIIKKYILFYIEDYFMVDKIKWIKKFIYYEDKDIRRSALDIISKFNYADAIEEVTICLLDPNPEIKAYAVEILGNLYAVEKKSYILKALEDNDVSVRISAIRSIRRLGIVDQESIDEVIKYLNDKDIGVVIEVLYTIKYLNLTKYLDEVFDIIKNMKIPDSKDNQEKFYITTQLINEAVTTLTYLGYNNVQFKKFLLEKMMKSNEPQLIKVALKSIGHLKLSSKEVMQEVLNIFHNPSNDPEILASAIYALGHLKQKDTINNYIRKKIGHLSYNELEYIYEVVENIYSPSFVNNLQREYLKMGNNKEETEDEYAIYKKKIQIIKILSQFTFANKVKDVLIKLIDTEDDVRIVNLIAEGLMRFSLKVKDFRTLYKIYEKIEKDEIKDKEGYLPICMQNIIKLISRVPRYFKLIFKDYDDLSSISQKKITYLEVLESKPSYVDEIAKNRIVYLLYNSKKSNGYDHASQVYRALCTIINLNIEKIIDTDLKKKLKSLIEEYDGNSKYVDAVKATKLLLLLAGDNNYRDVMLHIQNEKNFCNISEYLNILNKRSFLNDFKKIKLGMQVINGPLYLIFNTLNKKLQKQGKYLINYLNLPNEVLNRYMLLTIRNTDNLFSVLQSIKAHLWDFTYVIRDNSIILYTIEQSNLQWLVWYYKKQ